VADGPRRDCGRKSAALGGAGREFFNGRSPRFKFVTAEHQWLVPPGDSSNLVRDELGNLNRFVDASRTGRHLWRFSLAHPLDLAEPRTVAWADASGGTRAPFERTGVPLVPGEFFYQLRTNLPLGARVGNGETVFRLFAPRARAVTLCLCEKLASLGAERPFTLARRPDADGAAGVWEVVLGRNLHGWFYWYSVDGEREGPGKFARASACSTRMRWRRLGARARESCWIRRGSGRGTGRSAPRRGRT
jgi:hypothetical protein